MRDMIILRPIKFLSGIVARNRGFAHLFMAINYTIGDGLIATLPLIRVGFFDELFEGHADWSKVAAAYGSDPVPVIVSIILIASSYYIGRGRFSLGHAGYFIGALVISLNLAFHGELWTASAMTLTILGGAFGAFYYPLERAFGNSRFALVRNTIGAPKKMAGFCFSLTSLPTIFTAYHDQAWSLMGSGVCWLAGNCTSMLLPLDDENATRSEHSAQNLPPESTPYNTVMETRSHK